MCPSNQVPDETRRRMLRELEAAGAEAFRGTRAHLLEGAAVGAADLRKLGGERYVQHLMSTAPDKTALTNGVGLTYWHTTGLQSVEVSHKLAAALMATSAVGALDNARLPWPAFEIRIPPGLLESSHGEVYSCLVHDTPPWIPPRYTRGSAGVLVMYYDTRSIGHIGVDTLAGIARYEPDGEASISNVREFLRAEYDADREDRLKQMLLRLVTGVILLVTEARADKPTAYPLHPLRPAKRGEPRVNTHRVSRPVSIDVTATVRDFVRGVGRDSPHVTTLVRGHWRQQAHGPKHSLRRTTWIEPFWRGEGPISVRPTRLADRE
jgi:hypothetical protein